MSMSSSQWPSAIDPTGCDCIECQNGEYVPLERASAAELAALLRGEIRDNTNPGEIEIIVMVRGHGEIDAESLGITRRR